MGLFFSGPSDKYSQEEKYITEDTIQKLVSTLHVRSLDQSEERLVEGELLKKRGSDGKISMRQVYDVLNRLEDAHKISPTDKKRLLEILEDELE